MYKLNILTKYETTCPIGSQQSRIGLFVGTENQDVQNIKEILTNACL